MCMHMCVILATFRKSGRWKEEIEREFGSCWLSRRFYMIGMFMNVQFNVPRLWYQLKPRITEDRSKFFKNRYKWQISLSHILKTIVFGNLTHFLLNNWWSRCSIIKYKKWKINGKHKKIDFNRWFNRICLH